METYRIGWQAAATLAELNGALAERLTRWQTAWLPQTVSSCAIVPCAGDAAAMRERSLHWLSLGAAGSRRFVLGLQRPALSVLGAAVLQLPHQAAPTLAVDVALSALSALTGELGALPGEVVQDADGIPPWQDIGRAGGLAGTVAGLPVPLWFWADRAWCDANAKARAVSAHRPGLSPRASLLGAQRVTVRAELDIGEIALGEVNGLRVGEVLVGDASLEAAVRLVTDGRMLAQGVLRDEHGTRSVSIV
ncbi:FliM/FliN family flagellar motor C-terminal domain-containing protein [Xanthomonas sacchari]|uniref:FliM/FliN family flagellar motor C-terminal domain-containing protein n=1 Tax=Xanthomonas sacchari TaxID=56458 RepID=UPI00225DD9C9|nr:FliM/FliN family flagellar motor C-terminal domain-containing protein [Xanthomonas sacchari]